MVIHLSSVFNYVLLSTVWVVMLSDFSGFQILYLSWLEEVNKVREKTDTDLPCWYVYLYFLTHTSDRIFVQASVSRFKAVIITKLFLYSHQLEWGCRNPIQTGLFSLTRNTPRDCFMPGGLERGGEGREVVGPCLNYMLPCQRFFLSNFGGITYGVDLLCLLAWKFKG